jgi:23S rRNA pseudouridine1911/1915/1917 synthase
MAALVFAKNARCYNAAIHIARRRHRGVTVTAPSDERRLLPALTTDGPLLAWLLDALRPMSRTRVKQLLRHGRVFVNGVPTTRHDHPLRPGDRVTLARAHTAPPGRPLEEAGIVIVHEDDALLVIDKPPGLLTVATETERLDTAFARLNSHLAARGGRPFVIHRLDRDTSGLLLFARSAAVRDALQKNWDAVTKTYLAVVEGRPRPHEGVVENFLTEGRDLRVRVTRPGGRARRAATRYRVVGGRGRYTLVEVGLETGRKHQIRVHLAGLGCPVIGDPLYGAAGDPAGRLGLHAWRLALEHPTTGAPLALEAPFPAALRQLVE